MEALKTLLMTVVAWLLLLGGVAVALGWTLVALAATAGGTSVEFSQLAVGWAVGAVLFFLGLWLSMVAKRGRNRYYNS